MIRKVKNVFFSWTGKQVKSFQKKKTPNKHFLYPAETIGQLDKEFIITFIADTYIDARGIEGAFVGNARVANGVREAAVTQEASTAINDGPNQGDEEPNGWSCCQECRNQTECK